jgi:hypothetical protein
MGQYISSKRKHVGSINKLLFIPDISYHLVFCFLTLKELTLISQCNKEWKRMVTETSFLKMFRYKDILKIKDVTQDKNNLSPNPFFYLIHKIKVINFLNTYQCIEPIYLIHFHRLKSLEFSICFHGGSKEFDNLTIYQVLGERLSELKIEIISSAFRLAASFVNLQKALSCMQSLTSLTLTNQNNRLFTDISFLSQMKKLQSFSCDDIYDQDRFTYLSNHLSLLPDLTCLDFQKINYRDLKDICLAFKQSSSKLKHIGHIHWLKCKGKDLECSQMLNQIASLQTIDIYEAYQFPKLLGKWIHHLEINIWKQDISDIIHFPHLKSIELIFWELNFIKMYRLIDGLSSKLENLGLVKPFDYDFHFMMFSFKSISKCKHLKTLVLHNITSSDFDLLTNCNQLESIVIKNSDLSMLSEHIQRAFTIPSSTFPMLKTVDIQ